MSDLRKAAEMALLALEDIFGKEKVDVGAINALRQALAQPEQEPVAWADKHDIEREGHDFYANRQQPAKNGVPLYTSPFKREWQGLTDEEIDEGQRQSWVEKQAFESAVWWAEAKLKEKNT